ncbi:MAG: porin [Hyphomicrobium sp.]
MVSGLSAGSASAADLGGNCCADLEERIAELEATTARKGNRKVSLTISGWVAEQVMWWDDGVESNVYVQGIGTTLASHFKMTGQATIMPGWHAGYVIHVEVYGSENLVTTNQNAPTGPGLYGGVNNFSGINTLQSYWFVKSDHMGKIGVGLQSMASDNTAILPDGSGSLVPANFVFFDYAGFFVRGANNGLGPTWSAVVGCTDCNGLPLNAVRYDSPTWRGFSVSTSWGSDDIWDVAARYAGEHHGFKMSAAAAYSETSSAPINDPRNAQAPDTQFFQVGAYLQHLHSGLWIYGAYTTIETDDQFVNGDAGYVDNDMWYVKAGLRRRWHPLGHTVLYGEYQRWNQDALRAYGINSGGGGNTCSGFFAECTAETDMWGLGVVQEIDAAAMSMWLSYRHFQADINDVRGGNRGSVSVQDFQYVKFGALINF